MHHISARWSLENNPQRNDNMSYILKLKPALKDYLWGGTSLMKHFETDSDKISEAWVLSCHKDGKSTVINGELSGKTLDEVIDIWGKEKTLGAAAASFDSFPILIKLIDAKQNLSVQVHPDDEYALKVEGEYGKTEMWYILDAKEGAGIYYGFKSDISKEQLKNAIEENTLTDLLKFVEVKKGECYFIPAGTVHAIGAGLTIAEVQQNSNTTYRVYDFGRVGADGKPRELHIEKAMEVSNLTVEKDAVTACDQDLYTLANCKYFNADKLCLSGETEITSEGFYNLLIIEGEGEINGEPFKKYDSFFIPADFGTVTLTGNAEIIISDVK